MEITRFKKSVERGGGKFLDKIFTPRELAVSEKIDPVRGREDSQRASTSNGIESLAGIFAAKEAVIKALGGKAGDWHKIEIIKNKNGRPEIKLLELNVNDKIISQDISISHDGDYAIAVVIFLML